MENQLQITDQSTILQKKTSRMSYCKLLLSVNVTADKYLSDFQMIVPLPILKTSMNKWNKSNNNTKCRWPAVSFPVILKEACVIGAEFRVTD